MTEPKSTRIFLPFPPSTNGLFSGKERRFNSNAYKEWLKDAKVEFDAQMEYDKYYAGFANITHAGQVTLTFLLKAPDNRRRDLSNTIKAAEDFLVTQKVILDDDNRYVREIFIKWKDDMPQAGIFIVVTDWEDCGS